MPKRAEARVFERFMVLSAARIRLRVRCETEKLPKRDILAS